MEPRIKPNLFQTTCIMACLGLTTVALAEIGLVQITPAQPTLHDTITFEVEGSFSDGCWNLESYSFVQISPNHFAANVSAVDNWQPGFLCLQVIIGYRYSSTLGPLNPGTYTVSIHESHESQRDPWPNSEAFTFEVVEGLQRIQDLTVNVIGSDVVLNWSAVVGATGYKVYRRNDFELEFGFATLLDSTVTPGYTDSNVVGLPRSTYFYNVTATE
ncbi:MAG: hypothetical protein IPK53_12185 [bacterium]|nr:hypothetical protein [bacterium]